MTKDYIKKIQLCDVKEYVKNMMYTNFLLNTRLIYVQKRKKIPYRQKKMLKSKKKIFYSRNRA